ncbi:MAG: Maf family protein [Candidatus Brocadiia bacterium]
MTTSSPSPKPHPLYLASASKARADLLLAAGYRFGVVVTDVEDSAAPQADPLIYALERSQLKAVHGAAHIDRGIVIGADTVAHCSAGIIGKPGSEDDAVRTLRVLSSEPHRVITGLTLFVKPEGIIVSSAAVTGVLMRPMSDDDILAYVRSGEAMGKAGSYAVQETGDRYVEKLTGSYSNVVGLPMELLVEMLEFLANKGILPER